MKKQFLILYGWQGNKETHWQTWLAKKLIEKNQSVSYPEFPDPNYPKLKAWLSVLEKEVENFSKSDKIIVITHSLGAALWLHYANRHPEIIVHKVIMVSPTPDDGNINELKDFFPLPKIHLGMAAEKYLIVGSDNDQYIKFDKFKKLAENLKVKFHFIPKAGHINVTSGYGNWEWILKQCLKNN